MGSSIRNGPNRGPRRGPVTGLNPTRWGAPPQRQFPVSAAEWASKFPSLPAPLAIWTFQEAATPIDDKVGTKDFVVNGAATGIVYRQAGDPEPTPSPQFGVEWTVQAAAEFFDISSDTAFGNIPAGGTRFWLVRFRCPDNGGTSRSVIGKGVSTNYRWGFSLVATTGRLRAAVAGLNNTNSVNLDSANAFDDGNYHDVACGVDAATDTVRLVTPEEGDLSAALGAALNTELDTTGIVPATAARVGSVMSQQAQLGLRVSYAALFDARFTAAHMTTFRTAQ